MEKNEIYLVAKESMKDLHIEDGFLPEGATWIVLRLKQKKKKKLKRGDEYEYKWLLEIMPNMWVDFMTHSIKVENKEMYEALFTKPANESHIYIASREYFIYSQMEIEKRSGGVSDD